jgi:hypothetical protein
VTDASGEALGRRAREDIRGVLARFGISHARRAADTDATEEAILVSPEDFARIDPQEVAIAVMGVLPHTKVWVVAENPCGRRLRICSDSVRVHAHRHERPMDWRPSSG